MISAGTVVSSRRSIASLRACSPRASQECPTLATSRRSENPQAPLIFSSEGLPASHSATQAHEQAWRIRAATSLLNLSDWLADFGPAGWSGKTSRAFCRRREDGTLEPSSGRWLSAGMGGPTGSLTLKASAFPSGAVASSLSDVLEAPGSVPPSYYLSPRACAGILARAERRGRSLPPRLREILEERSRERSPEAPERGRPAEERR